MHRRVGIAAPILLLLLLASGGCEIAATDDSNAHEPLPPGSTYLLHLPGVAGDTPFDRGWMTALKQGGAADRVELYDWTCHDPGIDALQAYARNRDQAAKIARLICSHAAADPTGRIVLTAESGGAALAIWALEDLPRSARVDQVVLVQPALSPGYDLSTALQHVKRNLYYTSSPGDWFVLGWGTRVFGTSDGLKTDAAGLAGFFPPPGASAALYRKLIELRYDPAWMQWGDFGGHTGGMSTGFAYNVLAPFLKSPGPSRLSRPGATGA